jgi:hypothetical protein
MDNQAMKVIADELLNEAHRIHWMDQDGITLSNEYIIQFLLKIGNEIRDEIRKEAR